MYIRVEAVGSGCVLLPRLEVLDHPTCREVVKRIEDELGPGICFAVTNPVEFGDKLDWNSDSVFPSDCRLVTMSRVQNLSYHDAIHQGDLTCIKYHLERGETYERKNLYCATKEGHLLVVEYFVGLDPEEIPGPDKMPYLAARYNQFEILKWFIEKGWQINSQILYWPARHNHLETVKYLLDRLPDGTHHAFIVAVEEGHLELIQYLHEIYHPGVDPQSVEWGLRKHFETKYFKVIKYLHSIGGLPQNLVECAVQNKKTKTFKFLHQQGYPIDPKVCLHAVQNGAYAILRYAARHGFSTSGAFELAYSRFQMYNIYTFLNPTYATPYLRCMKYFRDQGHEKAVKYFEYQAKPKRVCRGRKRKTSSVQ